jgi:phosphoribosylformimino-5-aminoimidazole carboxamide ribotide isomerase
VILLPAIDILDGRTVRLAQGDFAALTVYDADPVDAARRWVDSGARSLHIVDLDGARTGSPVNLSQVSRIAAVVDVPIQLGGGLRSGADVSAALEAGASRVILGTAALRDVDFLDEVIDDYGEHVVVSVDARGGMLAADGWQEQTQIPVISVVERLGARGVRRFVYSNIDRDGTLAGPDLDGVLEMARAVRGSFVYSGGISSLEDLSALIALRQVNLAGVIVGKALYERRFDLEEAQALLSRSVA